MTNATVFGQAAETYRRARPGYPGALFDWVAENAPGRNLVWDCGTGSGQAAHELARRFERVHATDISAEQIAEAPSADNIFYHVADARSSGLASQSCDAVTVATALHWFADGDFWRETERVLRSRGLFVAWTYDLMVIDDEDFNRTYYEPVKAAVAPFWSEGNVMAMAGYDLAALRCPLQTVDAPVFPYREEWPLDRVLAMVRSWSSTIRACAEKENDALLGRLENEAKARFDGRTFDVRFPLSCVAARKAL